jgi:hypothetical protein
LHSATETSKHYNLHAKGIIQDLIQYPSYFTTFKDQKLSCVNENETLWKVPTLDKLCKDLVLSLKEGHEVFSDCPRSGDDKSRVSFQSQHRKFKRSNILA